MGVIRQEEVQARPMTKTEQYFRMLYGEHMRDFPKQRTRSARKAEDESNRDENRPWAFFGQKFAMRSVATFSSLYSYLWDETKDTTYYAPNSFYRSDQRRQESARWIHAFVVDIDVKGQYASNAGMMLPDVLDRVESAGLPLPTLIVQTPSGGYQVTWVIRAVRATKKTIRLQEAIQRHMIEDVGADTACVGVERIFRTPTDENMVYFHPQNHYDFEVFKEWRNINHPLVWGNVRTLFEGQDIMRHPAIIRLYSQDAVIGTREATCFNLAMAMKFSNWPMGQALEEMELWWQECCEKGRDQHGEFFTLQDALYRVRRVYRTQRYQMPSPKKIRDLTGMEFHFEKIRFYSPAKPREERKYSHKHEWKADLLELLQNEKGTLSGSLPTIAEKLGCAVSSLKNVLSDLQNEGVLVVESKRGRNGSTTLTLAEMTASVVQESSAYSKWENKENVAENKNSQIDITIGAVVGGLTAAFALPGSADDLVALLSVLNEPFPTSLPLYLTDLYRDTVAVWAAFGDDLVFAQAAATHTWLVVKSTLMRCLRATKRESIKNLTAYVRQAMSAALAALLENGYQVDRLPESVRRQLARDRSEDDTL
jgi:biotin operon repressor